MPVIRGNDVLTINGAQVAKQGLAYLRPGVTPDQAALATKNNGLDELILGFEGENGKTERVIVYGRDLDLSFRAHPGEPVILLNGRRGMLLHFDDEMNAGGQRVIRGINNGFRDAMDVVSSMARKSVDAAGLAGGAAFLGGSIWVIATKGAALPVIGQAAGFLAPKVALGVGATALVGVVLIVASAVLKALAGGKPDPRMETIAAVIDDSPGRGQAARPERPSVSPLPGVPLPSVPLRPTPGGIWTDVVKDDAPRATTSPQEDVPARARQVLSDPRLREAVRQLPVRLSPGENPT
ncbi:MAG: hypothetical protein VKQ33_08460 [Candidatus Sericytochromatia bacterium]|nr:hypothetical protein [Candidatus Sericytochromatia bacterium]